MNMNYRQYMRYSFILAVVIFVFLALNSDRFYFRLDFSRDQAFSISSYSKTILRTLPDDVELRYYFSPRLLSRLPELQEIQDILYEYQRISRGSFRVEIIDPDSSPEIPPEDLGIAPRELQVIENNEQSFALVYNGIAITYQDSVEIIPFIDNATVLEYEITSRLIAMTQKLKRSIAVILAKDDPNPQLFETMSQYLRQYYDISLLQAGDAIPPTADGLVVLGMAQLEDADLYAIEQFILSGRGVLIAAESAEVNLQQQLRVTDLSDSRLLTMLAHYGVNVNNSWVLDASSLIIPIQQQQGNVVFNTYLPYPPWVQVLDNAVHTENPVSARFQGLDLFWASPITLSEDLSDSEVLYFSSSDSVLMSDYLTDPETIQSAMFTAENRDGNYALAVSVSDPLSAWFTDPPEQVLERGISYEDPLTSSEGSRLLVFGDSDFPSELYQVGRSQYNIVLMQTILEYLVGDEELLKIRTRGARSTRLTALSESAANGTILLAKALNIAVIPILIILFALIRHTRRRRKAELPFIPNEEPHKEETRNE